MISLRIKKEPFEKTGKANVRPPPLLRLCSRANVPNESWGGHSLVWVESSFANAGRSVAKNKSRKTGSFRLEDAILCKILAITNFIIYLC